MTDRVLKTIQGLLSPSECAEQIALAESQGFEEAPVSTAPGMAVKMPDVRNNTRVMREDLALAALLWPRIAPHLPEEVEGHKAIGLNERFRVYRYDPGEFFALHRDGYFLRDSGERSRLTLMVYLNEGFQG